MLEIMAYSDKRQDSPRGSIKKPKILKPMQGESRDVSSDEARSDGQWRAYGKSKEGRRLGRELQIHLRMINLQR